MRPRARVRFGWVQRSYRVVAVLVLLGGTLASGAFAQMSQASLNSAADERTAAWVDHAVARLTNGFASYEQALGAERAFYAGSDGRVSYAQFRAFAASLELAKTYPGMQGIGFQQQVSRADLAAFVAENRAQGRPDFSIKPAGQRPEYHVVRYNEPQNRLGTTWGFDARADPTVRPYLEQARDTGRVILSGKAVLGVDLVLPQASQPAAFGLFMPVYRNGAATSTVAERRAALLGWASSPFRAQDFVDSFFRGGSEMGVQIFDGSVGAAHVIAASPAGFDAAGSAIRTATMEVGGRQWVLRFAALPGATGAGSPGPAALLIFGIAISTLLAWLLWLFGANARQRTAAAEDMTTARDDALAATAAKSAFLATMSHEIRTPMNAVIGMTGLLLDTQLDPDQRELAETVRDSGEGLLDVINDILDFSKIESSEFDLGLEQQPFTLRDCVEDALALVSVAACAKGIELIGQLDDGVPDVVVGDITRLRQVVVNLLGNAVKFTEAGEILVAVTAEPWDSDVDGPVRVTIAVTDTGIGIPADRMDRLFQSFTQVDSSTTRLYGGTGLGLAISRRLARAMGGDLQVTSKLGVGSTFTFTATLISQADRRSSGMLLATRCIAGRDALLVDDNATNRRVLAHQLAGWGMRCTEAATPAEALELVTSGRAFDVALLDMQLPDLSGAELAGALRQLPTGGDVPLILLTSLQARSDLADRESFAAVLAKPVRSTVLLAELAGALAPAEWALHAVEVAGGARRHDGPAAPPERPLRVLLAEDNPVNQKVAQHMLAKLGHRVDTVSNGLEAVAAVWLVPYDVVLMDVQMPELDGLGATERIRAELPPVRQPRILALTANAQAGDRTACARAGMDGYLSKPVRILQLRDALAQVPVTAAIPSPRAAQQPGLGEAACSDAVRARLADLRGSDPEENRALLVSILTAFVLDSAGQLAELAAAVERDDAAQVARSGHSLKGSAENLGVTNVAAVCADLESQARSGTLAAAPRLIQRLRSELDVAGRAIAVVTGELEHAAAASDDATAEAGH